jgi:hypothetical protein
MNARKSWTLCVLVLVGMLVAGLPGALNNAGRASVALANVCAPQTSAQQLVSGQTISGSLCTAGQQDTYYFDGGQGNQITVVMTSTSIPFTDIQLYTCCDASGHMIAEKQGTFSVTLTFTLPATARYALRAGAWSPAQGPYTITLAITGNTGSSGGSSGDSGSGQSIPMARFFGSVVNNNGSPIPDGQTVTATIGGVACGFGSTSGGQYSVDIQAINGCTARGATVNFSVGGQPAQQTGPDLEYWRWRWQRRFRWWLWIARRFRACL